MELKGITIHYGTSTRSTILNRREGPPLAKTTGGSGASMATNVSIRSFEAADLGVVQRIRAVAFEPAFRSFREIVGETMYGLTALAWMSQPSFLSKWQLRRLPTAKDWPRPIEPRSAFCVRQPTN